MEKKIEIFGARENNLKNIDVEFDKNNLVVITGVSGSGKSSLAFNTIYSEGQRRYMESFSAYARSFIGNIERFDEPIRNKLIGLKKLTKKFNNLFFILALSYGSRDEILKAIKKIIRQKKINITEKNISNHLMTKDFPDPDLVIRTSGEKRLSNFLLWQIAYSELYFTKTLWPEFNVNKYMVALNNFVNRKRRYGGD